MSLITELGYLTHVITEVGRNTAEDAWYDAGCFFTCNEAESIAALLRLCDETGRLSGAFLDGHGVSDEDPGDLHHVRYLEYLEEERRRIEETH